MFERYTERARQVIVLAQESARELHHNYIGTEHLLLGLIREDDGLAASVLRDLDITATYVKSRIATIVGQGDEVTTGQIPFTPRTKKVLELAMREALSIGHNYIGTEHILLGLVREGEGIAARILDEAAADAEVVRSRIIHALAGPGRPAARDGLAADIADASESFIGGADAVNRSEPRTIEYEIRADASKLREALHNARGEIDDGLASAAWHLAVGLEKRITAIEERNALLDGDNETVADENREWREWREQAEGQLADLAAEVAELKARPTQVAIIQVVSIVQTTTIWQPAPALPFAPYIAPYYVGDVLPTPAAPYVVNV